MQSTQRFVHVESSRRLIKIERGNHPNLFLYTDLMTSFPIDVPKLVHDVVSFIYHKRLERHNFWEEVKTIVHTSMTLDESDPNLTLARMLFGGILTHNIKIASQGKNSGRIGDPAFVTNIVNEPDLTIEKMMKAIDGTDHRAQNKPGPEAVGGRESGIGPSDSGDLGASSGLGASGSDDLAASSSGLGVAVEGGGPINNEGGLRDKIKDFVRGDRKHIKHFFNTNVSGLAHLRSLSGSDLRDQFPKEHPDAHLYYCFLVWLRAFADDLCSICFVSREKSRKAIDEYLSLRNSFENYLDAPFATHHQAYQIAIGISEMMRLWSTTSLDQWRRIIAPTTLLNAALEKRVRELELSSEKNSLDAAASTDATTAAIQQECDKLNRSLQQMAQLRKEDAKQFSTNLAGALKTIDSQSDLWANRWIQFQADRDALEKRHKEDCEALEKKRTDDRKRDIIVILALIFAFVVAIVGGSDLPFEVTQSRS